MEFSGSTLPKVWKKEGKLLLVAVGKVFLLIKTSKQRGNCDTLGFSFCILVSLRLVDSHFLIGSGPQLRISVVMNSSQASFLRTGAPLCNVYCADELATSLLAKGKTGMESFAGQV